MKYGIVIPCYNESERLPFRAFELFLQSNPEHICCFVNDGSNDDTLLKLLAFKLRVGRQVDVYDMPQNTGKAEAVRAGVNCLLKYENIQSIGFLDADLATGFVDYTRLERELEENNQEMVIGSRKDDDSLDIQRSNFRSLFSYGIGLMIKLVVRLPIKDTQCGAKVFSSRTAAYLFASPFKTKWLFDIELFLRLKSLLGHKTMSFLKELPLTSWTDVEGSKLKTKDAIQIPVMLIRIALYSRLSVSNTDYMPRKAA